MRGWPALAILIAPPAWAEAPAALPEPPERAESPPAAPPPTVPEAPPGAALCEGTLASLGVVFERAPPIAAPGGCGAARPLTVTSLAGVPLSRPAVLRCAVAEAAALWTARVVQPSARLHLGAEVAEIAVSTSYQCRNRIGGDATKLSEHALANALDVTGVRLADDRRVPIRPRPESDTPERAFQAAIRGGACAIFTTVIGPTTNAAHDDHLHLDMAERRGGFRLCQ